MSNLNVGKLKKLEKTIKRIYAAKSNHLESDDIKNRNDLFYGLKYVGEVLERFSEKGINDKELLTLVALEALTNPSVDVWENQRQVFFDLIKREKLDDSYLLKIVAAMIQNTATTNPKHDIYDDYLKLTKEEKMYLLERIIFTKAKGSNDKSRTVTFVRKLMSIESFDGFQEYLSNLENGLEKYYLQTLIIFSSKVYKKYDNLLKGKKELQEFKDYDFDLFKNDLGLSKEDVYFVSILTQTLFGDLSKVKTYRLLYHFFLLEDTVLINHLLYLDKKYRIQSSVLDASKAVEFLRKLMDRKDPKNPLFFIFMDYVNEFAYSFNNADEFKKLLSDDMFNCFKENNSFVGLTSFIYYLSNGQGKSILFNSTKELNKNEMKNLLLLLFKCFEIRSIIFTDLYYGLYKQKILTAKKVTEFVKSLSEDNKEGFVKRFSGSLIKQKYLYELGPILLGKDFKNYLLKSMLLEDFENLIKINDKEIVSMIIVDMINYLKENNLSYIEKYMLFLYKNKSIMNEEIYKQVEETILYMFENHTDLFTSINSLFVLELGNVESFFKKNTSFLNYNQINSSKLDSLDIVLTSLRMMKDEAIIKEVVDVIINRIPTSYRRKDLVQDYFVFISKVLELPNLTDNQKSLIKKHYFDMVWYDNPLVKRENKKEMEFIMSLM